MPSGDHPFNLALESAASWRMESPDWAYSAGLDLPDDPARRRRVLANALERVTEARRAFPGAQYEVTLGDEPIAWDETKGFLAPE